MQENESNFTDNENDIDIGRLLRSLFLQSKIIIGITLIGFVLSTYLYATAIKQYKISSMLQVFQGSVNSSIPSFSDPIFGSIGGSDVGLLVNLYKTRTNIDKIIKEFNLNIFSHSHSHSHIKNIEFKNIKNDEIFNFYINYKLNSFSVLYEDKIVILDGSYDNYVENKIVSIEVSKPDPEYIGTYNYQYVNSSSLYNDISSIINIEPILSNKFNSNEGILNISIILDDIELGKKILNYANQLFIESGIETETEIAQKAIFFIDQQLESLDKILQSKKLNLKNFKQDNQSINVDLEIQSIIETINKIEENLNNIEIELAEAATLYTSSNPFLAAINQRKDILINQKYQIESRIKDLPLAEQEYIDLYRDVEISQELYINLTNRKLSFSIQEASTLGNIRVVDNAYLDFQTSPRLLSIISTTLIFFIFAVITAFIRIKFFMPITNPAEFFDVGIKAKVYGVIPKINELNNSIDMENVFEDISTERSFESLLLNIDLAGETSSGKSKRISITSPTQNNGKSFISRALSKILAQKGKKVLLIDNDLVRGDQHKAFSKNKITSTEFDEIDSDNIENLKVDENLYLIPKIKNLKDSFNFLYSETYSRKIEFFDSIFDYIIFDTAPVLSVSDSSILMTISDLNFIIARHEVTRMDELRQSFFMAQQINKDFDGIIYNGYSKPKSYYGYYSLYGDYRYQYYANKYLYNYDYTELKNDKD